MLLCNNSRKSAIFSSEGEKDAGMAGIYSRSKPNRKFMGDFEAPFTKTDENLEEKNVRNLERN